MYDPEMRSYCKDATSDEICEAVDNGFQGIYNVLKAMKKREAVKPKMECDSQPEPWTVWWYVCGNCGQPIDKMDRYCRMCGKMVNWE